ncbi:MAG TPA: glycosyltransferase family 39 protein [bacterium]|nr:glycosyltransferase family 39 protein [bacterium]
MKKYRILFLILLLSFIIFRLFYIKRFNLSPDEAYYWCWSQNLSLSYYDHPPMVAYLIFFFTWLGENSEFFVRLSSVLVSFALTIFVYLLARDIFKSKGVGFFSALLLNIIPGFSIGGIIITPDIPLLFFWALAFYFLYQVVKKDNKNLWYPLGISLGLGLLSKYNMVLFLLCALIFLLLSKENRKWFRCKEPYLALLIAFLIFLPVIIWNYNHGWVSFIKQFGHGLGKKGSSLVNLGAYLGSQAGIVSPFLFFGLLWAMIKSLGSGIREKRDDLLLLSCFSLPIFLFFLLTSLRSKVEANWPAVGYFAAVIAFTGLMSGIKKKRKRIFLILLVFISSFILTGVVHYPSLLHLPPKIDPINRLYGWKQLGEKVNEVKREMGEEAFIFAPRHQLASEIAFYTDNKYQTYDLDGENRYNYWGKADFLIGKDAIFVAPQSYDKALTILSHFTSFREEEPYKIYRNKQLIKTFSIYRCYYYKGGLFGG